jgi:hypothetical protein
MPYKLGRQVDELVPHEQVISIEQWKRDQPTSCGEIVLPEEEVYPLWCKCTCAPCRRKKRL